ncbi:MAG: multicopper oxidase domain-containing protein [Actinomycetota bacterium]|nr:multicopper oxidase domain-containing protein [Actinomycetota bacterium]
MSLFNRSDRDAFGAGAAAFSLVAVVVALAALVTVATDDDGGGGSAASGSATVTLSEYALSPEAVTVPEGGTLAVVNGGGSVHNLAVEGANLKTADLNGGDSETLDVSSLDAGTYTVFCEISGHRESGMVGDLHIGDPSERAGHEVNTDRLLAEDDASNATMKAPVDAYVAQLTEGLNTEGTGNTPLEPTILADGTKEFELTAEIIDWQVDPETTVQAWAYNGQVPGPWIRVEPGDNVRVVLHNKLPQSTSIHMHGMELPNAMDGVPDVTQEPVKPGEDFVYEWVAKGPALGMYHSHHHAEHQVPDGLLGVIQVGDVPLPEGTGEVTQEIPIVLNDAGVIGLTLNAKSFPATAPVIAAPGDLVEIHYFNEGLQVHPMHLHGIPQLVVAKDGFPLDSPYTVDTLNVAPGERYTVLVQPTEEHLGVWAFHCHILTHAERDTGMFGMVTTFIVQ